MRAWCLAACLVLGLAGTAPVARAAAPTPADLATAKKLFQQGLKLYNEGSYREALAAFLRANETSPRASIQRNIAQCHRDLKDFAAAYDAYQALLGKYGSTMGAADQRAVQRAIDELGLLTGAVRVLVTEPGAAVTVDGKDAGTTPLAAPLRLSLGAHQVVVTKAGYEPLQKSVQLSGGDEARVEGPLSPEITTGHLVVTAGGAKVEVFVDGNDVGPAPWEGDVKPGSHVVEGRGDGRAIAARTVDVALKGRVEAALDLTAQSGRVQVDTHTADGAITIDGTAMGKGVWEGPLQAGQHEIVIEAPGYRTYRRAFLVHAGETFVEDTHLEAEGGGAAPRYDGVYAGFALFGTATPSGASNLASPSPSSSPLGGGLAVRFGYAFGWLGIEGVGFGSYDYSTGSRAESQVPARNEDYTFHRFGGGGLLGVRASTLGPHLRLTGSVLGGFAVMGNIFKQAATATASVPGTGSTTLTQKGDTASNTSGTAMYTAPALAFDAGVLVGSPNGVKVHVALLTMLQFVGDPVASPPLNASLGQSQYTTVVPVASGTQVFVGPVIGFDLGL